MRKLTLCAVAVALTIPLAQPASAVVLYKAGVSGGISPSSDLGACATLTFASSAPFTGVFVAVAAMQGPGTKAATVRGAVPIAGSGTWYGCIQGGYAGATAGEGKYLIQVSSVANDYSEFVQCVVNRGVLTCV